MSDEKPPWGDALKAGELVIGTSEGVLVAIAPNGTLTYGPNYTPDEAAKMFWEALARRRTDYEQRLVFITHVEKLLARVGEQDLRTETARTRAAAQDASPHDHFQAKRAMDQLNMYWHELIEFARGVALRDRANRQEPAQADVEQPMNETPAPPKRVLH